MSYICKMQITILYTNLHNQNFDFKTIKIVLFIYFSY